MSPARPLSDTERRDWVRLARTQNVGPITALPVDAVGTRSPRAPDRL